MQKAYKSRSNNIKSALNATGEVQLVPDEVHDRYIWKFSWPIEQFDDNGLIKTPVFKLCGTLWRLTLRIFDIDGLGFLSVHLMNQSDEDVHARYSFSLKTNDNREDTPFAWTDPEGSVLFTKVSRGDNEWGNDEFVSVDELEDPVNGLIDANNGQQVTLMVDLFVIGRIDINSHESLADAIGHATETEDLIKLANEDLHSVISKLPVRRNINAQKKQEDSIISARTHTTQSPHHHHK